MEAHIPQPEKLEIKAVHPFGSRRWLGLSIVFFLGFLAGFLIFTTLKTSNKDINTPSPDISGTDTGSRPADTLLAGDALHYETPLAKAECRARYSAKIVEIRVELSSLYPVRSLLEFDVNSLVILNVQHVGVNDQSTTMVAANFVQFNSLGDNTYIILLSNKNALPHKINFTLSQNDIGIYHNQLHINKE